MSNGAYRAVQHQIRHLFEKGTDAGRSEWQLLRRYVAENDEAAFESLVSRHGPMVLGVCRRTLDDPNDAEDAFQATFLVLVRRAQSLHEGDMLGPWLYGVASKVALRARAETTRRRQRAQPGVESAVAPDRDDSSHGELGRILDEECGRLPSKYRSTVVLCCFEGLTYEEAAQRSGCPVATLKGRLARARKLLRTRLLKRGVAPSAALRVAEWSRGARAEVPEALLLATTRASRRALAGRLAAGALANPVDILVEGVLTSMFLNRFAVVAAGLMLTGLVAVGVARHTPASAADHPDAASQPESKDGGAQASPRLGPSPKPSLTRRALSRRDPYSERQTEAILDTLDRPVSVQFPDETPLHLFLKYVKEQTRSTSMPKGIPIYIDPVGLQEAEKTMDSPVTIDLESIPLRVCVRLALKQLGLEYRVRDGVMIIGAANSEDATTPILELQTKAEQGELTPEELEELTNMLQTRINVQKLLLELHRLEAEEAKVMRPHMGGGSVQ